MTEHPVFDATEHRWLQAAAREWRSVEHHIADVLHKTPASVPATMKPATHQEETVSLATIEAEIGQRIAAVEQAVHNEAAKLLGDLPAITAEAKQLAGNPFAQVALKAAEHLAAGFLPVNAVATVAGHALQELEDLAGLYNPQGAQQAPAPADPAQAPAQ